MIDTARELADQDPAVNLPSDRETPAASPVRVYHLSPEEAALYPAVRPSKADWSAAAEQGWTPGQFADHYGRNPDHNRKLYSGYRTYLTARQGRIRRGEEPDAEPKPQGNRPHLAAERGRLSGKPRTAGDGDSRNFPAAVLNVLREHPAWFGVQIAAELGMPEGTLSSRLSKVGATLTSLRERVARELAAADPESETPTETLEVTEMDASTEADLDRLPITPTPRQRTTTDIEAIRAVMRQNHHHSVNDIARELGVALAEMYAVMRRAGYESAKTLRAELGLPQIHGAHGGRPKPAADEAPPTATEVLEALGAAGVTVAPRVTAGAVSPEAEPPETEEPEPAFVPEALIDSRTSTAGILITPDYPERADAEHQVQHAAPTCPICSRLVADCDEARDRWRSGRYELGGEAEIVVTMPDPGTSATVTSGPITCAVCLGPMSRDGDWYRCPACDVPETDAKFAPTAEADASVPDEGLPGICRTCVKADVCRHRAMLSDWFERAELPDIDLDIELSLAIDRCEAYRGEGGDPHAPTP